MTTNFDFDAMNRKVIADFRDNGGWVTGPEGKRAQLILVHHIGAKSGTERIAPLAFYTENDRLFIFASKGGAPENPAWYHNLVANPRVKVELGTDTFEVEAKVITGPEHDEIYAKHSALLPNFAEYQANTSRIIPVIELVRV